MVVGSAGQPHVLVRVDRTMHWRKTHVEQYSPRTVTVGGLVGQTTPPGAESEGFGGGGGVVVGGTTVRVTVAKVLNVVPSPGEQAVG